MEINRPMMWGSVFARGGGGLLVGDSTVIDDTDGLLVLNGATQGMVEIALGWEACRKLNNGMLATVGLLMKCRNGSAILPGSTRASSTMMLTDVKTSGSTEFQLALP